MCAGPQQNTTLPNVTFPSIQQVYGNVTFNSTNPGVPPAQPSNTPGNDSSARLPLFPVVQGVYSLVRISGIISALFLVVPGPVALQLKMLEVPYRPDGASMPACEGCEGHECFSLQTECLCGLN